MSVVRIGATKQYSDNWENIFSGGRSSSSKKAATKPAKKSPKKAAKTAGKKKAGRRRNAKANSKTSRFACLQRRHRYYWYHCLFKPNSAQLAGFSVKSLWRPAELAITV